VYSIKNVVLVRLELSRRAVLGLISSKRVIVRRAVAVLWTMMAGVGEV
jgi:hypothetical protein